jgi:hypothetical protein
MKFEKDGKFCDVYYEHGNNIALVERFAQTLQQYSLAKISKVAATQIRLLTAAAERDGDYGSVLLAARIFLDCAADDTRHGINIPAPSDTLFDDDQAVTETAGKALAAAYTLMSGKRVTFLHGALVGDTSTMEQTDHA